MKSITDYFSSPLKNADEITSDGETVQFECSPTNSHTKPYSPVLGISESVIAVVNTQDDEAPSGKYKKKRRKKKRRKPSDPAVGNIVQLLSNGLHLVSPETNQSVEKSKDLYDSLDLQNDTSVATPIVKVDKMTRLLTEQVSPGNIQPIVLIPDESVKAVNDNTKLNAFQFMMDSRNRSIGMNSSGKEMIEEISEDIEHKKEKLSARKKLLNVWAEQKSASKRKRDESLDETIRHKLNKRARRLKKLLNVEDDPRVVDISVSKKHSSRTLPLPSSSDSDSDFELKVSKVKNIETNKTAMKLNVRRKKNSKSSPLSGDSKEEVIDFKHLSPYKQVARSTSPSVVIEENSVNKVLVNSKSKECRKSILSFFGVSSDLEPTKELITKKHIYKNATEKNTSIQKKCKKNKLTNRHEPFELLNNDDDVSSIANSHKVNGEPCKTRETEKKLQIADESSQDNSSFTGRRLRSWKIKINLSEENKKPNETNQTNVVGNNFSPVVECTNKETTKRAINISSGSDDDYIEKKSKRIIKMAPLFTKSTPKPKEDPKIIEARKQFLMSGIPSSLRKVVEKEQSLQERECVIFPTVSHIQQKGSNIFWNLPFPNLPLRNLSPVKINNTYSKFSNLTKSTVIQKMNIQTEVEKIDKLKLLLNKIKRDNPNYPVYKSYRIISKQCGNELREPDEQKSALKRRGKKKKRVSSEKPEPLVVKTDNNNVEFSMWTDKYKPRCADDIIGNTEAVKNLKKWLVTWMNFSQEIISRKKRTDCSESEFETTDGDSRESMALPGNTVVLGGPCGSGKSTAVYAMCSELGFNVIELNASSKRTGKRLLQKIQEATRSHQVRKGETNKLQNLFDNNPKGNTETEVKQTNKKMVLIFIEDIDIVFEQDEGFISALTHLIATSKRPIILTTTDYNSVFVQKFLSQYEYIPFLPLSSYSLSTWLQILCLVEGIYIDRNDLGSLLDFNNGDVRKTLLELQFWVKTGGQINRTEIPIKIEHKRNSCEDQLAEDEQINYSDFGNDEADSTFMHKNCIKSFELFEYQKPFVVPYHLNLEMFWWNIPNILGIPGYSEERVDKFKLGTDVKKECTRRMTESDKNKFKSVTALHDLLSLADVMLKKVDTAEPIARNHGYTLSNSLELGENYDLFNGNLDFAHELTHNLVNRFVKMYNRIDGNETKLDLSAPGRTERRWRSKLHLCEDAFHDAISLSNHLDRKSVSLDYIPALRNISRNEFVRAENNTKRGNRFRNYLRNLGLNYCNGNVAKLACNILQD